MKIEISATPKELAELMAEIWERKMPRIQPMEPVTPNPLTNDPKVWKQTSILTDSRKAAD